MHHPVPSRQLPAQQRHSPAGDVVPVGVRLRREERLQLGSRRGIQPVCTAAVRPFRQPGSIRLPPAGDLAVDRALETAQGCADLRDRLAARQQQQRLRALPTPRLPGVGRGVRQRSTLLGGQHEHLGGSSFPNPQPCAFPLSLLIS